MDNEETNNSLPYINDIESDDELPKNQCPYNLKIIENYQNKNRNIEITNKFLDDTNTSLSPVAPLAEETEVSNSRLIDSQEELHQHTLVPRETGLKLVIKGWNSTICIQGLDNKSSITFKRRSERICQEKVMGNGQRKDKSNSVKKLESGKPAEKTKKGRWKMLTRTLISKSARFERRGIDERYPKYVLLKDEEEVEKKVEESYPKMVVFNERRLKKSFSTENTHQKENINNAKSEFNLKRPFKNKTKPIMPLEEILSKEKKDRCEAALNMKHKEEKISQKPKKPLTARNIGSKSNLAIKKKIVVERSKSCSPEKINIPSPPPPPSNFVQNESHVVYNVTCSPRQAQVFNDIQGIFEDTLKFYPDLKSSPRECLHMDYNKTESNHPSEIQPHNFYGSLPSQFCQFPCHDSHYYPSVVNPPPVYIPVYTPYSGTNYSHKSANTQTNKEELDVPSQILKNEKEDECKMSENNIDSQSLPLGILSSIFPRVVIMKTLQAKNLETTEEINENVTEQETQVQAKENVEKIENERKEMFVETLEVPLPDLQIKSKMTRKEELKPDPHITEFVTDDIYSTENCFTLNEISSSDEEHKTKTDESEATEYLHFRENDSENELEKPPFSLADQEKLEMRETKKFEKNIEDEKTLKNLSLTKVGYKMYDNLTKLSLNREKEVIEKPETTGCGCNGNQSKKSPYSITLESNNKIIKVSMPEEELNFQIVNTSGPDIQIGFSQSEEVELEGKKIVKKNELWYPDDGRERSKSVVLRKENLTDKSKDLNKIKFSLANNKDVVLSIEMKDSENEKKVTEEKTTKEMKIGTDDFLAGGDFVSTMGTNYKNLSPRTGQLLKNLQEKLEFGERERKLLEAKINEKLESEVLPGIFLVKQISPKASIPKKPSEVPSLKKTKNIPEISDKQGRIREYYCEECLATMRIFEDESPSVKSMVDKFETIIQLESY